MNQIHTSYKTSKMLKEFLGESAPEPMMSPGSSFCIDCGKCKDGPCKNEKNRIRPIYMLHDLLSKPFLCAFVNDKFAHKSAWRVCGEMDVLAMKITNRYVDGGLPAVEKALTEMMEGK